MASKIYHVDLPRKALYPYDYQYTEIFVNLLARGGLMCPGYSHLYIQVAKTEIDALKCSGTSTDWFVNGIAAIDYENYKLESDKEKSEIVFDLICEGLLDIAEIDKLDRELIERTISEIKEKGLDTELIFKVKEHKKYKLIITYFAKSMEEECPVFFNIEDKELNRKYRVEIGKADKSQIWLWLQKISLTQKKIKIKSSKSVRGNVWLKNKEKQMEFDLADLMKKENEYNS